MTVFYLGKTSKMINKGDCYYVCPVLVVFLFLAGCSYQPVVLDNKTLYFGAFKKEKEEQPRCNYSEVKGVGLRVGVIHIGIGYFNYKTLKIEKNTTIYCENNSVKVYVIPE